MSLPLNLVPPIFAMAPMVTQSDRPFRRLVRAHGCTLCYTEMLMADRFAQCEDYRKAALGKGVCADDHPLVVQLAANDPTMLRDAARWAQKLGADAVDLNLGCPQGKAKTGNYGAWLASNRNNWPLIEAMVAKCARDLEIPIFCKIRLQATEACSQDYALRLQAAGCALLAVHGRRLESAKERRGGAADLATVSKLKAVLQIPVLSNGNVKSAEDVERNLAFTQCDGIMVAEQLLRDPALFQRAFSTTPSTPYGKALPAALPLIHEYLEHCLQLDAEECFSVWDLRNVDVLRNHLRSMLTGAVGSEEAEEGTQRLLTDLRDRARGRYILEWWRLQQASSVQEVVKLYREKCGSIGQAEQAFILCSLNVWARETADSKMFSVQTLDRLIPF
ncbi:unnamed protein product [Durusdinium trenchii]|uniref:tRNA-dihydrouridine(16/17) synthase [NAD(P)(+)] n=1 Tax=Durusdinium trenchii TaxID=1381693 RepID=A0ABP0KWY7_9DINO